MSACWGLKDRRPSVTHLDQLILLAIADNANDDGIAWPSQTHLARKVGCARPAANACLKRLADLNLIRKLHPLGENNPVWVMQLNYELIIQREDPVRKIRGGGVSEDDRGVSSSMTGGVSQDDTEPSRNHQEEPTTWRPLRDREKSDSPQPVDNPTATTRRREADPVWDALLAVCAVDAEHLTTTARGAANRALKELKAVGATAAQIRASAQVFRKTWPEMRLTPSALVKHWAQLVPPGPRSAPETREAARRDLSPQDRHPAYRPAKEVLGELFGMPS